MSTQANAGTKLAAVDKAISKHYPALSLTVKAGLAVFGTMSLSNRTKPLSLIFETVSGYGKSAVVQMFFAFGTLGLERYVYRCDKFTPKAFVTHAASVSKSKLAAIDLLPKLTGKVLVTKELAPIFRGREEELTENFSTLIAVLDGKGFASDSGIQGKRGYEQDIVFNWLGATTPLPRKTHKLMYQLGTRLLFWEVPSEAPGEDELYEYAKLDDASLSESVCQKAVNAFLVDFFAQHPIGSVAPGSVVIPDDRLREIAHWSRLLAMGRREIQYERNGRDYEPVKASKPEGPYKIVNYFKELARGHALIHERFEVNADDIALVAHIAISSLPGWLRPIVTKLRQDGAITSAECEGVCGVRRKTARQHLLEASLLGLGALNKGNEATGTPDTLSLSPDLSWLKYPCSESGGCGLEGRSIGVATTDTQGAVSEQGTSVLSLASSACRLNGPSPAQRDKS